jgi:hypothetical protein
MVANRHSLTTSFSNVQKEKNLRLGSFLTGCHLQIPDPDAILIQSGSRVAEALDGKIIQGPRARDHLTVKIYFFDLHKGNGLAM